MHGQHGHGCVLGAVEAIKSKSKSSLPNEIYQQRHGKTGKASKQNQLSQLGSTLALGC